MYFAQDSQSHCSRTGPHSLARRGWRQMVWNEAEEDIEGKGRRSGNLKFCLGLYWYCCICRGINMPFVFFLSCLAWRSNSSCEWVEAFSRLWHTAVFQWGASRIVHGGKNAQNSIGVRKENHLEKEKFIRHCGNNLLIRSPLADLWRGVLKLMCAPWFLRFPGQTNFFVEREGFSTARSYTTLKTTSSRYDTILWKPSWGLLWTRWTTLYISHYPLFRGPSCLLDAKSASRANWVGAAMSGHSCCT